LVGSLFGFKRSALPSAAATQANVLGPHNIRFVFIKSFGSGSTTH
jgi:hypothetical protein